MQKQTNERRRDMMGKEQYNCLSWKPPKCVYTTPSNWNPSRNTPPQKCSSRGLSKSLRIKPRGFHKTQQFNPQTWNSQGFCESPIKKYPGSHKIPKKETRPLQYGLLRYSYMWSVRPSSSLQAFAKWTADFLCVIQHTNINDSLNRLRDTVYSISK